MPHTLSDGVIVSDDERWWWDGTQWNEIQEGSATAEQVQLELHGPPPRSEDPVPPSPYQGGRYTGYGRDWKEGDGFFKRFGKALKAQNAAAVAKAMEERERKRNPPMLVKVYKNASEFEKDYPQMVADGYEIEGQSSKAGKVNLGRTAGKLVAGGVFWAVARPSRKGDSYSVIWVKK